MRPITPQLGYIEADTVLAMASGQFAYVDCYTFEPKIGDKLRYANTQKDVTVVPVGEVGRQTYLANKVGIRGLRVKNNIGIEVDEQEVSLFYPDAPIYQASLTWAQALLQGRMDGGKLRRDRYIAKEVGTGAGGTTEWLGGFPMFSGLISSLSSVGRQEATIKVKSDLILLDRQAPAFLFEANCKNTWGDPACGVDQKVWAVLGTVGASPTRSKLPWSGADPEYAQGKIHISNFDDVTRVRTIARADSSYLYLAYPLDFDPAAGYEFTAYPGCSRTNDPTTGCPKYHGGDWPTKFKGFPFIPVAETGI